MPQILKKFLSQILFLLAFLSPLQTWSGQKKPLKEIKLSLDWLLSPHHAPLIIADKLGFLKKQGLSLKILPSVGSSEGCKQVSVGRLDYAICTEPQLLLQGKKGFKITHVATLVPYPLEILASRVPLDQIKGKRIGHASSGGGFSVAALNYLLHKHKASLKGISLIYTRNSLVTGFLSGQTDAAINLWGPYEGEMIKEREKNIYIYDYAKEGVPTFCAAIIVASCPKALHHEKFRCALREAVTYIQKNLHKAWKVFITYSPELDTPLNRKVWATWVNIFDPTAYTKSDLCKLEAFIEKWGSYR